MPRTKKPEPINPKAATDLDRLIGAKVRRFRLEKGMSQERLADALGVTFQQLQKYENGMNRMAVSRLAQIARTLKLPLISFFEDLPDDPAGSNRKREVPLADQLFSTGVGRRMAEAFVKIDNPDVRHRLADLCASVAGVKELESEH